MAGSSKLGCQRGTTHFRPLSPLLLVLFSSVLRADDVQLVPAENASTAFAGSKVTITFRVNSERPAEGRLLWSHTAQQRTLSGGEADVRQSDDGPTASFDLRLPEVRDAVIYQTHITAEFVPRDEDSPATKLQRPLWLFPRDPLAGRAAWAEELNLQLVDSDGRTGNALRSINLPFQQLRTVNSALPDRSPDVANRNRILLVGEGASLAKGTLIDAAVASAQAGRKVVVLAPQDGAFFMPGIGDEDGLNTGELRLVRQSVIKEFDKRLDSKAWPGVGNTVPSQRLQIEAVRGRVRATIDGKHKGWPWLELRYPESGGALILCGFRIVEHWDRGPTPRFLLIRILESLAASGLE